MGLKMVQFEVKKCKQNISKDQQNGGNSVIQSPGVFSCCWVQTHH